MEKVQQFEPISTMQQRPQAILERLSDGPVILSVRSKAAAVVVSVEEWDRIASELAALRSDERMTKREVEVLVAGLRNRMAGGPRITHEELKQMMMERSANVAN
jgi:prevent-host-death family protein